MTSAEVHVKTSSQACVSTCRGWTPSAEDPQTWPHPHLDLSWALGHPQAQLQPSQRSSGGPGGLAGVPAAYPAEHAEVPAVPGQLLLAQILCQLPCHLLQYLLPAAYLSSTQHLQHNIAMLMC